MSADDLERVWLALTLPDGAGSVPLDETIVGDPASKTPAPLPYISVSESLERTAGAPTALGPDLVVVGMLGEGGMGRVQLARQRSLEREVAVKRPRASASEGDAELLRAEAVVTGHLEHPNIVPIHALGVDDGRQPLIIMKRVEGVAWRDLLHDDSHPGWARREPNRQARLVWHLQILAQLCNAIAFAHARGFVHRDMKPGNVMIGEFGEVYLIDWGVAVRIGARSQTGDGHPVLVGTPAYLAPEMARGEPVDQRTDVYLLGATLHEILTGRLRHEGADLHAVTLQALASAPVDYGDEVPDELAELANRATARDPAARPPDALAFRQALLDHLHHRGSLRLSAEADRALAAIEADPAGARAGAIDECRFGYREALREWPGNPDALRGLRRCAVATIRLELERRNPAAARAALDALDDPPADLVEALAHLESELAADREERDRLRRLAEEADPTVGTRARVILLAVLFLVAISISMYALRSFLHGGVGTAQLLAYPSIIAATLLVSLILFRREFAANAFNRRMAAWFLLMVTLVICNRLVGVSIGVSPLQQFTLDGVLMTGLLAAGAIFIFRWLWACAALMAAGCLYGVLDPARSLFGFGAAATIAILMGAVLISRAPRETREK